MVYLLCGMAGEEIHGFPDKHVMHAVATVGPSMACHASASAGVVGEVGGLHCYFPFFFFFSLQFVLVEWAVPSLVIFLRLPLSTGGQVWMQAYYSLRAPLLVLLCTAPPLITYVWPQGPDQLRSSSVHSEACALQWRRMCVCVCVML